MTNKDAFFRSISPCIRKGILREIYTGEDLAVLRVADSFYIATDYTPGKDGFVAFLVNSKMIQTTDAQTLSQMMFYVNGRTFRKFRPGKGSPFSDLTHRFVDPAMEEWIYKTYGLPISPETQNKKLR